MTDDPIFSKNVVMKLLGMKYGTKKMLRRATEIFYVIWWYHTFKFQDCYWLKLIAFCI